MMRLTKISQPGWRKVFFSEVDLVEELRDWVCDNCISSTEASPPIDYNNMDDLLWTACGCEFMVENG